MIRRWSCVKLFDCKPANLVTFVAYQHIKIFRKSVKFKRYYIGITRFTRRHIRKLKHKATWAVYYNVLKYWTDAVKVARQYARFQYNYRFFVNNFIVVHGNTFYRRRNHLFLRQDQCVMASLTRCLFLTSGRESNKNVLNAHRSNHHAVAFFPTEDMLGDLNVTPTLAFFDKQFFVKTFEPEFDQFLIFLDLPILQFVSFLQLTEIYKILINVWCNYILNLNNNVWSVHHI